MRIPVRNREMNPAFGLPTVEIRVQTVERCPTRIDCFVGWDIAVSSNGCHEVIGIILPAVGGDIAVQSVAEGID
jgi:hypothetical protein